MTLRFAYPNIKLPRGPAGRAEASPEFIGCGRFLVAEGGEAEPEGAELPNGANTPNKGAIDLAVDGLVPRAFDSAGTVREIKDRADETYKGSSMDVAWLLANVHRARPASPWAEAVSGDVWCTGAVETSGDRAAVSRVESMGFTVKLDAFLAPDNPDRLFLCPAPNLTPDLEETIRDRGGRKWTLDEALKSRPENVGVVKTVVTVPPGRLGDLVSLLFRAEPAVEERKPAKWVPGAGIALVLAVFAAGLVFWLRPVAPKESLRSLLENGRFSEAAALAESGSAGLEGEGAELRAAMNAPVRISAALEVWRAGEDDPSAVESHPAEAVTLASVVLTARDNLRVALAAEPVEVPVYLYLFLEDDAGEVDRAFPNAKWNPGLENPVRPAEFPLVLPGSAEDQWFYLDERDAAPDAPPAPQTFHVVAAPWPARDLLRLFGDLKAEAGSGRKARLAEFGERLKARETSGLPSVVYRRIRFGHGG